MYITYCYCNNFILNGKYGSGKMSIDHNVVFHANGKLHISFFQFQSVSMKINQQDDFYETLPEKLETNKIE